MSSDLKLEIFAFQFFQKHWRRAGLLVHTHTVSSMYPDEYVVDPKNTEIYEDWYIKAAFIKEFFYRCIFYEEICKLIHEFQCSPSYILDSISLVIRRDGSFSDLTIFELFFVSLAYVMNLALFVIDHFGYKDVLSYAHLCWTAYFDQHKEEFYEQGGWRMLKFITISYSLVYEWVFSIPNKDIEIEEDRRFYIRRIMKAVSNYKTNRSCFDVNCKTISKAWVKFQLQNCDKFDASDFAIEMTKEEDMKNPKLIEQFLLQFRRNCDPQFSKVLDVFSEAITRSRHSDCEKKYSEEYFDTFLKMTNLSLKNAPNSTLDPQIKLNKKVFDSRDIVDQTDNRLAIDLSGVEQNDDRKKKLHLIDLSKVEWNCDEPSNLLKMDLSRNKGNASNGDENKESENASTLKSHSSSYDFSYDNTQNTNADKSNEDIKSVIDLERESPEVKSILKMILVLGDREGLAHFRSNLPTSGANNRTRKFKKK